MKKTYIIVILVIIIAAIVSVTYRPKVAAQISTPEIVVAPEEKPILTHQQEVWQSALEWCESRGVQESINPKDRDGTPSYYSWQFKPSTFKGYGIKYGVIPKDTTDEQIPELLKNYELQKKIVGYMILDKSTNWEQQFPDCVKRKIGRPPMVK